MDYLVRMKLIDSGRPAKPEEGIAFVQQLILPSLERCKQLQEDKKILAGGPVSGSIELALIVRVDSAQDLDNLLESLPIWPRTETSVYPLTSFDGRISAVTQTLERIKAGASIQQGR